MNISDEEGGSSEEESTKKKEVIPKNAYVCSQCGLPPRFNSIKEDSVQINCITHGVITLPIEKYLSDMASQSFCNYVCDVCKKTCQKGLINNKNRIFKYCYDCQKKICHKCIKEHKALNHEHIVPCTALNDKCDKHLGEDYTLYCYTCKKNICMKCNSEGEHKTHKKELLEDIEPSRQELQKIMKKREDFVKIKDKIKKQYEQMNDFIFLFDNIIATYQEHKTNFNHIENILDLLEIISIRDRDKEIEELQKQKEELMTKGSFQQQYLDSLNKKYNTELTEKDVNESDEIYLSCKEIDDEGFNMLCRMNFKSMKVLHLSDNEICEIDILASSPFRALKELYLFGNGISNIDVLARVPFKQLQKLNLGANEIEDISVLKNVPFKRLQVLELWENHISNIDVLSEVPFKKLKELSLSKNKITSLEALRKVSFRRLERLSLHDNLITDIDVLKEIQFKRVQRLYFENNKVDYSLEENQKVIEELKKIPDREIKY